MKPDCKSGGKAPHVVRKESKRGKGKSIGSGRKDPRNFLEKASRRFLVFEGKKSREKKSK